MQMQASSSLFVLIFMLPSLLLVSSSQNSSIAVAKPNCDHRCGNISIPFPFGTTEECYSSYSFWVTCNHTSGKLFWLNDTVAEITHISLDGQIRFFNLIAKECYDPHGTGFTDYNIPAWKDLPTYFTVNNTANKFTTVGCDAYAFVYGSRLGRNYTTGCTAICYDEDDLIPGSCMGPGCCQTTIPRDVSSVGVDVRSYSNYSDVLGFDNCGYAFVVEESFFIFSKDNLTNLKNVKSLPMVVDWAMGNGTCDKAKMNATGYACVSPNSGCFEPGNGYGYRCRCDQGYHGNPYLSDGCRDIDECSHETRNNCTKNEYCRNEVGSYTCSCPQGYSGDGRGKDGCKITSRKQDMKIPYILIGVAFGFTAILFAAILLYLELKRRSSEKTRQKYFLQNGGMLLQEKLITRTQGSTGMVKIFSSSELRKATNDFHTSMIVGQGGFGTVYKGVLSDNKIVAIKKSKRVNHTQIEQFINEVLVLSQINHRNVVRLLGCCLETDIPLLVYEFISNGTLSSHLHNKAKARFLDWGTRLKIAAETAGVLSYLHSAASTPIIHRDMKSDNILLDRDFIAKVSDFGASKLVPLDLTQLSTMVQGTFGYLDPEYMQSNQLTEKSDVYSFGVVLLELLTGRRAISFDRPEVEKNLANFFLSLLKQDRLFEILDVNIVGEENMEQISKVARLGKECLNVKGEDRPSMKEVAMELEELILSGKHSSSRKSNDAEESLLRKSKGLNQFANSDENRSYDSIRRLYSSAINVDDSLVLGGGR